MKEENDWMSKLFWRDALRYPKEDKRPLTVDEKVEELKKEERHGQTGHTKSKA